MLGAFLARFLPHVPHVRDGSAHVQRCQIENTHRHHLLAQISPDFTSTKYSHYYIVLDPSRLLCMQFSKTQPFDMAFWLLMAIHPAYPGGDLIIS